MSADYQRSVVLAGPASTTTSRPTPSLNADIDVDVAIVGAGFTGLWTAYYLAAADPTLRIAVLESEIAGFGASGRNGGWCSALFPQSTPALAEEHGRGPAIAMHRAMCDDGRRGRPSRRR